MRQHHGISIPDEACIANCSETYPVNRLRGAVYMDGVFNVRKWLACDYL